MIQPDTRHHESLLTQLLLTGSLVVPVANLVVRAQISKSRKAAKARKEGTR